jgi:hypothetical protein
MFLFGLFIIDISFKNGEQSTKEIEKEKMIEFVSFDYNSQSFETSQDTSLICKPSACHVL